MRRPLFPLHVANARIQRHGAALRELVRGLDGTGAAGPSAVAAHAGAAAVRFFDRRLAAHHAREEQFLFPALLEAVAGSDGVCLRSIGAGLAAEHREIEMRWRALRAGLASAEPASPPQASAVEAFVALCERHTACEGRELLPMAERLMSDDAIAGLERALRHSLCRDRLADRPNDALEPPRRSAQPGTRQR